MNAGHARRIPRLLLAVLSGGLLALSFPGSGDQGWLAFVALVPLLGAIADAGWRDATLFGFLAGFTFWLGTVPWVATTMVKYGGLPWIVAVLVLGGLAAFLALYTAAFCALLSWMPLRAGGPFVIVAASLWVALEFLRTYLFTGFPWNLLGYSQYRNLALIQIAAVTGVYGVSFVVAAVNAALWGGLDRRWGWRPSLAALSTAGVIVALAVVSGGLAPAGATGPMVSVALAQGSIDQGVKWDPAHQEATLTVYRDLTLEAGGKGARLVVWPETAVPFFLREDPRRVKVERLASETGVSLLIGAPDRTLGRPRNSAFLIGPDGGVRGRYDKRHLVPFGEYVPLKPLLPFVNVLAGGAIGDFVPGAEAVIFTTPAGRVGVVICYEAIFPAEVRDFFLAGADVLVNITNDAWFGRSAAPLQHLAMAALRAVENRAYLVRAANSGISAIVAPDGRIVEASGLFTRQLVSGTISPRSTVSLYTRYGDLFAWATVGLSLAAMWPVTLGRGMGMRWLESSKLALRDQAFRVNLRRGLLAALLAAAGGLTAAVTWGWRSRLANGSGYQDVAWWRIPGGRGRFIAVDAEPTADELRALGERLRREFQDAESAVVVVFDDAAAAREIRRGSRAIGEHRFQAALAHQRAMYVKHGARGEHSLRLYDGYPRIKDVVRYDLTPARE